MKNLSEISINYQPKLKLSTLPKVSNSEDAKNQFKGCWSNKIQYVEEVYLMLLNRANKVLGFTKISYGGTTGSIVDIKVIFQVALKSNAHSIILCHNHPSGSLKPSSSDIQLTNKVKQAGILMDIPLLDHLIITNEGYYSFGDEGIL